MCLLPTAFSRLPTQVSELREGGEEPRGSGLSVGTERGHGGRGQSVGPAYVFAGPTHLHLTCPQITEKLSQQPCLPCGLGRAR